MEAELINNTIAYNDAGGVYNDGGGNYGYYNIVAFNNMYGVYVQAPTIYWGYNLVYGHTNNYTDMDPGSTDVNEDPLFLDPDQADLLGSVYVLDQASPAINMIPGDVRGYDLPAAPITDIDGNPRPLGGAYDAGCYEVEDTAAPFI